MSSIEKAMQRKSSDKAEKSTSIEAAVAKEQQDKQKEVSQTAEQAVGSSVEPSVDTKAITNTEKPLGDGVTQEELEAVGVQPASSEASPVNKFNSPTLNIDIERLQEKGFVALTDRRTLINEEYRSIKRKLLNNAFGPIAKTIRHSNLILVSSSKPNEGKTFTAVNLALSIALEQDKTVLLVDSDVLKPSVSKTLEIGENVGLIEYLLGEQADVRDIMYRTNVENLRVIPAGLPHHLSNELLSSDKMMKLIEEFATRYPDRIVVFDAPPLLGVNETAIMAEQCGQGVIVVEEHKSKVADVKKAVDLLPQEMAVGFVLNKVTTDTENQGYGYYYGSQD